VIDAEPPVDEDNVEALRSVLDNMAGVFGDKGHLARELDRAGVRVVDHDELAGSMARHPAGRARRCGQTFTAPGTGAGYVCAREPHSDLTHDWQPLDRGAAL